MALLSVIAACLALILALLPRESSAPAGPSESQPEAPSAHPDVEEGGAVAAARPDGRAEPASAPPARVAIVIDDVGYSLAELEPFLSIPGPLAFAVLPGLPHSGEAARRVHAAGKEVIVHMPMQPAGSEDPGPLAILVEHSEGEIRRRLAQALASVPHARGVSNHMGSRATGDRRTMDVVMAVLAERDLFFLDSRTTAESVATEAAAAHAVPLLERSLFLDNDSERDRVEARLREGFELARGKGCAILIGHVQSAATREVLSAALPSLEAAGFRRVALAELLP